MKTRSILPLIVGAALLAGGAGVSLASQSNSPAQLVSQEDATQVHFVAPNPAGSASGRMTVAPGSDSAASPQKMDGDAGDKGNPGGDDHGSGSH